ncbi:uncharacterized protein BKCO1_1000292 [Diplodia corticola]|uniref:MJ1316 RNA cyclic group end recognition domain-containing protein n=1 Tax=Diplodia corticola TaxID=236234 RepID=A0A1J9S668_9PEZI|nr:uncharacterized protein BKCO1_1000292 [Diplodia corticola]OJD40443.1 hypothetical protein BKCO1_1000292 [Diplodia corticola]
MEMLRACISQIHAALPQLRLLQHPSVLAPADPPTLNPQPLRYLVGVARQQAPDPQSQQQPPGEHDEKDGQRHGDDATLPTRLTCGLQAFLKQLRIHPVFSRTSGLWLNARYITRADLGAVDSLASYSPPASAHGNSSDGSVGNVRQQHQHQQTPALPESALSAIGAALRIAPEPSAVPTIVPHSSLQPTAQHSASLAAAAAAAPGSSSGSKAKLRPVSDVLDRLRWDDGLGGTAAYAVGYRDRFDGVLELSLDRWVAESTAEDWIPLHRVSYVKRRRDGVLVWWREGRVDLVFGSGNGAVSDANVECEGPARASSQHSKLL